LLRHPGERGQDGDDHDRHVDQEDHAPPELAHQPAAEGGAADRAQHEHRAPDRGGLAALLLVEHGDQDGQGARHDQRPADTHEHAGDDHLLRRLGERAEQRRGTEQQQPDQQELSPAEAVGQASRGEQQADEHQQVGVDDPLDVLRVGTDVAAHRGDRGRQHEVVEYQDEGGQAEHHQDEPPLRVTLRLGWGGHINSSAGDGCRALHPTRYAAAVVRQPLFHGAKYGAISTPTQVSMAHSFDADALLDEPDRRELDATCGVSAVQEP
jgi:hypothetical protein